MYSNTYYNLLFHTPCFTPSARVPEGADEKDKGMHGHACMLSAPPPSIIKLASFSLRDS